MWQLCDGRRTVQQIIDLLTEAYPDAAVTLPADVSVALQQFADHGAIDLA